MTANLPVGRTVITPNALDQVNSEDVPSALARHVSGDWGEVDASDWAANDLSVKDGSHILSAYRDAHGVKFWVITEADRPVTSILLPEDY